MKKRIIALILVMTMFWGSLGDIFTGLDAQRQIIQNIRPALIIAEGNVIEIDAAGNVGDDFFVFRRFRLDLQEWLRHFQNGLDQRKTVLLPVP